MTTPQWLAFIPTFFFVSLTPGLCMTLSLTLGMTIGVKRALFMMAGELLGVGLVATTSVIGAASFLLAYPQGFWILKTIGASYLAWIGIELWRSRGRLAISSNPSTKSISGRALAWQGFITAIANPKGWAFFVALLPPFINLSQPLPLQLSVLILVILLLEFFCLIIYATGGRTLRHLLSEEKYVRGLNRLAGSLMIGVAVWLLLS